MTEWTMKTENDKTTMLANWQMYSSKWKKNVISLAFTQFKKKKIS